VLFVHDWAIERSTFEVPERACLVVMNSDNGLLDNGSGKVREALLATTCVVAKQSAESPTSMNMCFPV
jgi:hypothetical protein